MPALALILAVLLSVSGRALAAAPLDLVLRSESVVSGAYFSLGEISAPVSGGAAAAREVAELRIGRSPRPGAVLRIRRAEVEMAIVRLRPALKGAVRVSGPDIASVRRGPLQAVDAARVRDAAARELQARLAERYLRFEVEPLGDAREVIALPEGKLEIRPRAPLASDVLPARLNVWVDLYIEGLHHQSLPVPFMVRAYAQVLSAREMLRPGALLRPQDLTIRDAQVAGLADAAVRADTDVAALRVRQPVPAGELLTWRHVAQAPAVSRNQDIIVRLVAGPIELQTAAVATQDGRTGDVIRVRAVEGTQTYAARVSGTGTAEALWGGK